MTAFVLLAALLAADPPDPSHGIVPSGAKLEKVWGDGAFTEGPAYGPGACVYFSDIGITPDPHEGNRIMKSTRPRARRPNTATRAAEPTASTSTQTAGLSPPRAPTPAAIAASRAPKRTARSRSSPIAGRARSFNSPNDVTIDTKGRIYFSDPRYVGDEPREIDTECVYRIDPDGTLTQLITDVEKPNGIILSPDMKTLYVAEANPKGKQQLLAYPLNEDGSVGAKAVLYDFGKSRGIDGMVVDVKGNIYAAAGEGKTGGVYVFSPEGKRLASSRRRRRRPTASSAARTARRCTSRPANRCIGSS